MSEQVESQALVVPGTGEVINLENEREVAIAYKKVKAISDEAKRVDRLLREAMGRRKSDLGKGTFYIEGVGKVEVSGEKETEYDPVIIEEALREADAPEELITEIIVPKVEMKVDAVRARQAAAANPKYAEAIEKGKRVKLKLPTVTIT